MLNIDGHLGGGAAGKGPGVLVLSRELVRCFEAWRIGRTGFSAPDIRKTAKSELIPYQMSPHLQKCVNFINCEILYSYRFHYISKQLLG